MKQLLYGLLVLLAAGCKEKYDPPIHSPVTGYLVVDGVINSAGPTMLTLTRTTKFDNRNIVYETGAGVSLQGQDSSVYQLSEKAPGQYGIDTLSLNSSLKYRLRINAASGRQYISDFAIVKTNPPVDSISWKRENGSIEMNIHTHDPQNATRYYQWYYDETWEFQASFISVLKYQVTPSQTKGNQYSVVYKDSITHSFDPSIVTCWQFNSPTNLFLGSTAKLSQDIIDLPIAAIPPASIELSILYSIHVKQYAWTKEGYEFLEKMKKNTESTGTIFDPQPSELNGNIHCSTDATEPVVGYFNICPVQEKRIFIKNSDVPGWGYNANCIETKIENNSDSIIKKASSLLPTVVEKNTMTGGIDIFRAAPPECVDCTLTGTNKKPAYWP